MKEKKKYSCKKRAEEGPKVTLMEERRWQTRDLTEIRHLMPESETPWTLCEAKVIRNTEGTTLFTQLEEKMIKCKWTTQEMTHGEQEGTKDVRNGRFFLTVHWNFISFIQSSWLWTANQISAFLQLFLLNIHFWGWFPNHQRTDSNTFKMHV